ncbi:MAG: DUF3592 domain-containing protein [Acidobacteriota bacterium]|nr:DUF3592 domain-containing protein [Acidobacteriota bacterium]
MLIELWEKLRGYDKWVETTAIIQSSRISEEQIGTARVGFGNLSAGDAVTENVSSDAIAWKDHSGSLHNAQFKVDEDSPLFQLYDGQSVKIRYNPANPDQFYLRGLERARASMFFFAVVLPVLGAGVVLTAIFLREYFKYIDR